MTPICNLCGSAEFKDFNNRPKAICARCGAYERTRVLKLLLDRMDISPRTSVLHIAPERGLYTYLKPRTGHYVPCDIDVERYAHIPEIRRIDLCDASTFEGLGLFDLIIHNHVIEHVPCNWTVVMVRLHRMLKDGGHHMFSLPIYGKSYEEDLADLREAERTSRFGQYDHCRRFSPVDLQRTLGAVFRIPTNYDLESMITMEALDRANIPGRARHGMTGHSVFALCKDDLIL